MGRADQTTKIKGMFVRPEQVADFVKRHPEVTRARVVATRDGDADAMTVRIEAPEGGDYTASLQEVLKLRGDVEIVPGGTLPADGVLIEDKRSYD
jgi:phenylacetate-CoA ligase